MSGCNAATSVIGLMLCAACQVDERIAVALPPLGDTPSAILRIDTPTEARAWALTPAEDPVLDPLPALLTDEATLALASFQLRLEQLGLQRGELDLAQQTAGSPLPAPHAAFVLDISGADPTPTWTPHPALPSGLDTLRVRPGQGPCRALRATTVALPDYDTPGVLWPIDDTTYLVGTHTQGAYYRVSRAGVEPLPALRGLPGSAMAISADEELWLFGEHGRTAHGTLARGFVAGPAAPSETHVVDVVPVPGSTQALDVFAATHTGGLLRFDGRRWTRLVAESEPIGTYSRSMVALAADHVVMTTNSAEVARWRRGQLTREQPYPSETREIEAVGWAPGLGLVAGAAIEGRLLVDAGDGRWTFLGAQGLGPDGLGLGLDDLVAYEDGLFMTGTLGAHTQWWPDWGYCEPGTPLGPAGSRRIHVRGDGTVVVLMDIGSVSNGQLVWLDP